MLTHETLIDLVHYDENTGVFTWRKSRRGILSGRRIGSIHANGYLHALINGERFLLHRLAWFYVHGVLPSGQIDHINRIKTDNRISNLRDVTPSQNSSNSPNRSELPCIRKHRNKWQVRIKNQGTNYYVGVFQELNDAIAARNSKDEEFGIIRR